MLQLPRSNGLFVQSVSELPSLAKAKTLFADFETTSGDPHLDSLNPWHHCGVAGLAITVDREEKFWYIPAECLATEWCQAVFSAEKTWVNHNIKYDAQVLANQKGIVFAGKMICTLAASKLIDSDRWTHSLDALAADWLGTRKAKDLLKPYLKTPGGQTRTKDYGDIPADVLGDYACEDVRINRLLHRYIESRLPEESRALYEIEKSATTELFTMERVGMTLRPRAEVQAEQFKVMNELINVIGPEVSKLAGYPAFEPHINEQCHMILTEHYQLPVLAITERGKPSYDKHVLAQYLATPGKHTRIVELCLKWRELWIYNNLFLKTYLSLAIDDVLHATYNQVIRTGRMSCAKPNMQQVNLRAKSLIIPKTGYYFFSTDARQIEFRLICHYIQNPYALQAYTEDPDTDYHKWVAQMVGIPRRPAKTMNFMLGYGGGKAKTVSVLQLQAELMETLREGCHSEEAFQAACKQKANQVYADYHEALPELKIVAARAASVCRARGYIRNLYGRRRTLPTKAAHKAFNTINQATAADLIKEMLTRIQSTVTALGARTVAVVHDEFLIEVPVEVSPAKIQEVLFPILESPSVPLRVPIRWDSASSKTTWAGCKG